VASLARVTLAVAVAVTALAACGGDDASAAIEVQIDDPTGGLVDVDGVECRREDDRILASGVVHNEGDTPHYVSISVRFVDGEGVRVELSSDSVSDLVTGESAQLEVSVSTDRADTVVRCDVATDVS